MKKRLLKTIAVVAVFAMSFITAQAQNFFTYIPDAVANLNSDQAARLANMRANQLYQSVNMVQVANFATFQSNGKVTINLPGYPLLTAYANNIQAPGASLSSDFWWEGNFTKDTVINGDTIRVGDGYFSLYYKGGQYFGGIKPPFSNDLYELVSFATGKNAIIKFNKAVMNTSTECGNTNHDPIPTPPQRTTGAPCNTKVRVLIVYTQLSENQVPNIQNTINRAMGDLNGTINNCMNGGGNSKCYFELAGSYKLTNFTQAATSEATKYLVAQDPIVRQKQDEMAADIIVYLASGSFSDLNSYGNSFIYDVANPIAVVRVDVANANYTFAHEVGHVMGGRHQQSSIDTRNPDDTPGEPHGYHFKRNVVFGKKDYGDIMHVLKDWDRSHIYSTPNIYIWSHAIGVAGTNDVTKTILENVCAVSEIRPDEAIYFTAEVTAQTLADIGATVPMHCTPINGMAPYTYQWKISTDGNIWTTLPSTTEDASFVMPNAHKVYVLCYVTDVNSRVTAGTDKVTGKLYVSYDPYSGQDAHTIAFKLPANEISDMKLFPNPATNQVGVVISIPEKEAKEAHTLIITDVVGKTVYSSSLANGTSISLQIDLARFASGSYFVKLLSSSETQTKKLTITK